MSARLDAATEVELCRHDSGDRLEAVLQAAARPYARLLVRTEWLEVCAAMKQLEELTSERDSEEVFELIAAAALRGEMAFDRLWLRARRELRRYEQTEEAA